MELDKKKMDSLVSELEDHEKEVFDLKGQIQHELFNNLNDAVGYGLMSINWEAIRKRRYLRR